MGGPPSFRRGEAVTERFLFLIRHGRSDFSSTHLTTTPRGSQWDPPLGHDGREQAELLARRLVLLPTPAAVYCSPFRRCRETVAPYVRLTGSEVTYVDDLGEAFVGEWEGRSFEDIVGGDAEMLRLYRHQEPMWHLAPGGEPPDVFRRRVVAAVDDILAKHTDDNVVVIAHGGVINAYIAPILGLHEADMFYLPENTSLNTVIVDGDERRVRFLSDTRHLTEPAFFAPEA
jgi:broad specificity phosphatase PhoE